MNRQTGRSTKHFTAWYFLFLCSVVIRPEAIQAQTAPASAAIMVEIRCKPGTSEQWRDAFIKEILPSIREAIRKGDVFTNFAYFEAPLPAQEADFVLLFEMKSFSSLDAPRIPPHYETLFRRVGPEGGSGPQRDDGLGRGSKSENHAIVQGAIVTSVLVTGAGGFIGHRVVSTARAAGYRVVGIARKDSPFLDAHSAIVHDLQSPLKGLSSVDWVFHFAGGYAGAGHAELESADLRTAQNVIAWGVAAGVKNWVFASAAEVYGAVRGVATEGASTQPVIPYGRLKLAVERLLVEKLQALSDHRIVILRIAEVYGRYGQLIGELTSRLNRGFCLWPGSGNIPLSFVHVDDVAQAFLCAARRAPIGISTYNVGDDMPATWHKFLTRVAQLCRAKPPVFLPEPFVQAYAACSALACRIMGREPILTSYAVRLLLTAKPLSNVHLKRTLGFQPLFPSIDQGLEEVFRGLSHHS